MNVLREGAAGPDVSRLQSRLAELGFPPGTIDGSFGPGTEAALVAFQRSEGLLADGVLGPRTAKALGFAEDLPPAEPMPAITVSIVAKMFPATPLDHIQRNLPAVLAALRARDLAAAPIMLAALATIRAETEGFVPVSEGVSRYNTSPGGRPFDLYDNRRDLGNQGPPDGANFRGRGFIQLTGRANYAKYGAMIGLENRLVASPDEANDPTIAAQLLAAFIFAQEIPIKTALLAGDLAAARRLVNGGAHGLDRFSEAYRVGKELLALNA